MKSRSFFSSDKNIKLALTGLLLKGTLTDFCTVLSLDSIEPVISAVAVFLFVLGLIDLMKQERKFIIISTLVVASVWGITYILYPGNIQYMKAEWMQTFIYSLPFMWLGYYFIKHSIYLDYFLPIAKVKLCIALVTQLIILLIPSRDIWEGDYMNAANALLVGLISVYYLYLFKGKKPQDLALAAFGTLIMFICGSRGALVSIAFFLMGWWYLTMKNAKGLVVTIILLLVVVIFGSSLFSGIASLAATAGFSTHLVDAVSDGGIFEDEARSELFTYFLLYVQNSRFGYGVMGDRMLSDGVYDKPIYPHNLYIETLVDFGYILGGILSIVFTYYMFKMLLRGSNLKLRSTILTICSFTYVRLLFSNSFWGDQMFFLLIGTLLASKFVKDEVIPHT